ncbi:hypothetical protein BDZ94DRAFT_331194 [Collybia nuda]|uniref:Uncharacterized protein n=1 Tax=Collybia nuda TaxID=64659 RepID=A0A9P5XW93_9AGAR|nr:hypothetical protein BDZ94DRAFT_331194 [Collybia nuda]
MVAPGSTFCPIMNIPRICCRRPSSPVYHHQHTCATYYNPVPALHHRTTESFQFTVIHHTYISLFIVSSPVVLYFRLLHAPPFLSSPPCPSVSDASLPHRFRPPTTPHFIRNLLQSRPLHSVIICARGCLFFLARNEGCACRLKPLRSCCCLSLLCSLSLSICLSPRLFWYSCT